MHDLPDYPSRIVLFAPVLTPGISRRVFAQYANQLVLVAADRASLGIHGNDHASNAAFRLRVSVDPRMTCFILLETLILC